MARLLLSKSTLLKEKKRLESFLRFLPSLEMKRQQLMIAVKKSQKKSDSLKQQALANEKIIADEVPMLAIEEVDLQGLCQVKTVHHQRKNIVGVWLVDIRSIDFELAEISILAKPHWVEFLQTQLKEDIEISILLDIEGFNLDRLKKESKKVTQRVNLFDKVLIPEARRNMRKIQLFLDDKDREMVVTSKLSKTLTEKKRLKNQALQTAALVNNQAGQGESSFSSNTTRFE
jgi:V/A-type H+-transporting ATPase subunit D